MNALRALSPAALLFASASAASAQVVATLIAIQGDPAAGSTISTVNAPFIDNAGGVGFVASLADSRRAIMRSTGTAPATVSWDSSLALPSVLTGGESTMGISASGGFIYSPSAMATTLSTPTPASSSQPTSPRPASRAASPPFAAARA